jgi:NDP-sugar pyrophosphorylase family protein
VTEDKLPKSLYKVQDKELIRYTLDSLDSAPAIDKLIFAVDHQADTMVQWIHQQKFSTEIVISQQKAPGIVAAIMSASPYLTSSHFILCNTDEIRVGLDVDSFINQGLSIIKNDECAMATTRARNLFRHRVIETNGADVITTTTLKGEKYKQSPEVEGMINIGFLMVPKSAIHTLDERYGNDWSSVINPLVELRKMHAVFNPDIQYFNVGTSSELDEANEFLSGMRAGTMS